MKKFIIRDLATSLTTLVFLIIGITGVMMYFHILDKYTKSMHEILGLFFVVVVLMHIYVNFKPMKNYFRKKVFLLSSIILIAVSGTFVLNVEEGKNPKHILVDAILQTPLTQSLSILQTNIQDAKIKLASKDIKILNANSIKEIASQNSVSPFMIVQIISE